MHFIKGIINICNIVNYMWFYQLLFTIIPFFCIKKLCQKFSFLTQLFMYLITAFFYSSVGSAAGASSEGSTSVALMGASKLLTGTSCVWPSTTDV